MKKRLAMLFAMALLCIGHVSYAQLQTSNWKFSNPKKFGFGVQDVSFIDDNNGIAVGVSGGIARTSDGGVTWQYAAFTFSDAGNMTLKPSFAGVHFVTPTIAYAVGNAGLFAKSTDGGFNWTAMTNPLFPTGKSINTVCFINKDTGYIAGQANAGSTVPRLYFTRNGGVTWDSIAAPVGPKTRIGYIANPSRPAELADVTAEGKEIHKIVFVNDSVGYVVGSGSNSLPYTNINGGISTTGGGSACLVWKFRKGVLTDYSISKERTGYAGINTATVTTTTLYNPLTPSQQTIKAVRPINDSVVVIASFNNAIVVRIKTGFNDSTENLAQPGVYMKGKYEMLNYPFPPLNGPSIPAVPVLPLSNMSHIEKAANGWLLIPTYGGQVAVSTDNGANWTLQKAVAPGAPHSNNSLTAIDITPNGRVFVLGANGVTADSIQGSPWGSRSNHTSVTFQASYEKIKAADCNNIIAVGGGQITVTTDGGQTWIDKVRQDFVNSFININSLVYNSTNKLYLGTSHGYVYNSADQGSTLDPIFTDPYYHPSAGNGSITALATSGNDRIWAFGMRGPTALSERTMLFRTLNAGISWDTIKAWPLGADAASITEVDFPTATTGYAAGGKGRVFKTTDAGATWTNISPFPALNATMVYSDIQCLDANTIFVIGNGFPRKVIYRSTDGGASWTDISPVITNVTLGNLIAVLFHDQNSGYVVSTTGMLITTNAGSSWTLDQQPGNSPNAACFVDKTFPPGTQLLNRKVMLGTLTFGNFTTPGGHMFEYGNAAAAYLAATETVTNANCTNANGGAVTVNTTGALAPYTYSIDGGSFQTSNVFSGLTQGAHVITVRDAGCQSITRNITVGFDNNLSLSVLPADTTVCAGAPVTFRTTSTATSYAWSPAAGLSNAAIANPVATVNANTTYTLTATLNGCTKTAQARITIIPSPVVNAGPDKTIVNGNAAQLNGSSNSAVTSIAWTPAATLTDANTFTPTAKPTTTTTYTLTVKNSDGCTSTDEAVVTVIPYCLRPMNAFTPNGDGFNDRWFATQGNTCTEQVAVKIFNRYGGLVYSNDHYQNDWNGEYKGKTVADGTYYYVVIYKLINGNRVTLNGDLTILR